MKVRVRLFAAARQAAGCETVELELPRGGTVGQLRRRLAGQARARAEQFSSERMASRLARVYETALSR